METDMRKTRWTTLCVAAGILAACGSKEPQPAETSDAPQRDAQAAQSGNATAEQVAKESRGKVTCKSAERGVARAASAPVDDVLGVRPGMTYDDAANVVLCTHDLLVAQADTTNRFNIQTFGQSVRQGFAARFAKPRVEKSSKQIVQEMQDDMMARSTNSVRPDMQAGESKWYVSTMGMPGEEMVIGVAREEWFDDGSMPTVANVERALKQKYGTPTRIQPSGRNNTFEWAYDPSRRLITESSPLFHVCHGTSDPDGATHFSPDCGVVVAATIISTRDNPDIAQFMQVGVLDQASGYERITATEKALQEADSQRRSKEVEAATMSSTAPKL